PCGELQRWLRKYRSTRRGDRRFQCAASSALGQCEPPEQDLRSRRCRGCLRERFEPRWKPVHVWHGNRVSLPIKLCSPDRIRGFSATDASFGELSSFTGGEFQPPTTLMIRGESGSGTTTLGLQLVYESLQSGRSVVILTYESFPSEIQRQMKDMGWDVQRYVD